MWIFPATLIHDLLCDILTSVGSALDAFPEKPVTLVGDFNFDFTDRNCGFSVLKNWMSDCHISAVPLAADRPTPCTYFNDSLLCSSHIDHFLVSKTLENLSVLLVHRILSDHLPLSVR